MHMNVLASVCVVVMPGHICFCCYYVFILVCVYVFCVLSVWTVSMVMCGCFVVQCVGMWYMWMWTWVYAMCSVCAICDIHVLYMCICRVWGVCVVCVWCGYGPVECV